MFILTVTLSGQLTTHVATKRKKETNVKNIMLSVNFFCNTSSYRYFGIYRKELFSVDILCENSISTMPVSRGEGGIFSCLSSYV